MAQHALIGIATATESILTALSQGLSAGLIRQQIKTHVSAFARTVPKNGLFPLQVQGLVFAGAFGAQKTAQRWHFERTCRVKIPVALGQQAQAYARSLDGVGIVIPMNRAALPAWLEHRPFGGLLP